VTWAVVAYVLAPRLWEFHFRDKPDFSSAEHVTQTSDGHPGDPVNLALIGSDRELVTAMRTAGWYAADPITFETSLAIAADSVLRRPDDKAPVSDLFLFGRKQDLAFEQPVGNDPRQRHHVRFWRWNRTQDAQTVWFGAATYDERVGLNWTTGQVTHHISPDIDTERDRMVAELTAVRCARSVRQIDDFHREREGRNGGGDLWRTDGRLAIVTLQPCVPPAP
jgi:hypothetical protein